MSNAKNAIEMKIVSEQYHKNISTSMDYVRVKSGSRYSIEMIRKGGLNDRFDYKCKGRYRMYEYSANLFTEQQKHDYLVDLIKNCIIRPHLNTKSGTLEQKSEIT
jgi:hypothetical protein